MPWHGGMLQVFGSLCGRCNLPALITHFFIFNIKTMNIIKPPQKVEKNNRFKIFLAGSIEMGAAENWQDRVCEYVSQYDIDILNPRRDNWDSSWEQSIDNENFKSQVEWELNALDAADKIMFYFDPATKSPISLLELGLHANSSKLYVCCPKGFWRSGNIEIVCKRFNIPLFTTLEDMFMVVKLELSKE